MQYKGKKYKNVKFAVQCNNQEEATELQSLTANIQYKLGLKKRKDAVKAALKFFNENLNNKLDQ